MRFNLLVQFMNESRLNNLWLLGRSCSANCRGSTIAVCGRLRIAIGSLRAGVALVDRTAQRWRAHGRRGGRCDIHWVAGRR
jgi:hypothetical protein